MQFKSAGTLVFSILLIVTLLNIDERGSRLSALPFLAHFNHVYYRLTIASSIHINRSWYILVYTCSPCRP
jgi:hypothetical protein